MSKSTDLTPRTIWAGILAWVLPGAGHYYLGHRGMATVFFLAISIPYWTGVAIGGVLTSVNPYESKMIPASNGQSVRWELPRGNKWLFLAEIFVGSYTTACYYTSQSLEHKLIQETPKARVPYVSFYPESDVAQIYLATAGLLNLLAILDAMSRAQYAGLPVIHKDMLIAEAKAADAASPEHKA